MNTKHTESKLLTRQASKEENDLLISRIDSTYEAAKLRWQIQNCTKILKSLKILERTH